MNVHECHVSDRGYSNVIQLSSSCWSDKLISHEFLLFRWVAIAWIGVQVSCIRI